jgi:hypothetical protein
MAKLTLELSPETLAAMEQLAAITGATKGLGELIQDATRMYEYLMHEQLESNPIVAVPKQIWEKSPQWKELVDHNEIRVLAPIFDLDKIEEARKYFSKAA